jgi:DNA-binding NarL/FixJ family response regulator
VLVEEEMYPLIKISFMVLSLLTKREREIAILLSEGLSCPVIAEKLFLSLQTVKTHCKNIYRKLEVNSRYELIIVVAQD